MPSLRNVTLIGADGSRHTIVCDVGGPYQLGTSGQIHGVAPYAFTSRRLGIIPGETLDSVRAQPRVFAVPLLVQADDELGIDQRLAALGGILDPDYDCRVVYERPDGTEREITARYTSGGEATIVEHHRRRFVRVPLVFTAYFPYWRAVGSDNLFGPTAFIDALGGLQNDVVITNNGDVDTWPIFTVTGYTNQLEIIHPASGSVIRFAEILEAGQTLRIDTDPRQRAVEVDGANAYYPGIDPVTRFFSLHPGDNDIYVRGLTLDFTQALGGFTIQHRDLFETC